MSTTVVRDDERMEVSEVSEDRIEPLSTTPAAAPADPANPANPADPANPDDSESSSESESGDDDDQMEDDAAAVAPKRRNGADPRPPGDGVWQGYELESEHLVKKIEDIQWAIEDDFGLGMQASERCKRCKRTSAEHKDGSFSRCHLEILTEKQYYRDLSSQHRVCEAIHTAISFASSAKAQLVSVRQDVVAQKEMKKAVRQRLEAVMRSRIQMRQCVRLILDAAMDYLHGKGTGSRFTAVLQAARIDLSDDYLREDEEQWVAMERGPNVRAGENPLLDRPPTPGSAAADATPLLTAATRPVGRTHVEDILEVSVGREEDLDRDLRETLDDRRETRVKLARDSKRDESPKLDPRMDPRSLFSESTKKKIDKAEKSAPNRDRDYREKDMRSQLDDIGVRAAARADHQEDVRRQRMDELNRKHEKERKDLEKEIEGNLYSTSRASTSRSFAVSAAPSVKNDAPTPMVRSSVQFPPLGSADRPRKAERSPTRGTSRRGGPPDDDDDDDDDDEEDDGDRAPRRAARAPERHSVVPRRDAGVEGGVEEAPREDRFPALYDPPSNVNLKHRRGGRVCGGTGCPDVVSRALKLIRVDFKSSDGPLRYLDNRRELLSIFDTLYGAHEIYDLLSIFRLKSITMVHTIDPLLEQEAKYTSFLDFLRYFEASAYPGLKSVAQTKFDSVKQLGNQEVRLYYLRFLDLVTILEWRPDDYVRKFVNGLFNSKVRENVQARYFEEGTKTLEAVYLHAAQSEREQPVNNNRESSDEPRKKKGKGERGEKAEKADANAVSAGTSGSSEKKGKKGKKGEKKANHPVFKNQDTNALLRDWIANLGKRGLGGCVGCLSKDHRFSFDFKECGTKCLFCAKKFSDEDAHPCAACSKMPAERKECLDLFFEGEKQKKGK